MNTTSPKKQPIMPAMKKPKLIFLALVCVAIAVTFIVLRITNPEDDWICSNGAWVKHGSPSAPRPTTGCSNTNSANSNLANWNNLNSNTGDQVNGNANVSAIASFEDCAAAGYPIMESYPRRCAVPSGKTFTEDIGNELALQDIIQVDAPRPNAVIASPITIQGEARGSWFNEAVFPISVEDAQGIVIGTGTGIAQTDWMTDDFVPFKATIEFSAPSTTTGTLILNNSNPSGSNENFRQLSIPVQFP
ncbi:MAG: Gmad2 immunoglobulin-like domain-containing protein [Patescibacteria group bacterium]|nr:Gmad2 immunoglobulin-like domain-containing protein [Patescibacteria group bacterium]